MNKKLLWGVICAVNLVMFLITVHLFFNTRNAEQVLLEMPISENGQNETIEEIAYTEFYDDEIMPIDERPTREMLSNGALSFSHIEFFNSETFMIYIYAENPYAEIFYTLDGSAPTEEANRFTTPLVFEPSERVRGYVLKAVAIDENGKSDVLTQTYFVGENVHERFTTYVFSISIDDHYLFDYYNGILVPGVRRTRYLYNNPYADPHPFRQPANYRMRGREWERRVNVEVFNKHGVPVLAHDAGMRVHGQVSRSFSQKSLRLIARREYSPEIGRFRYDFFGGQFRAVSGEPISSVNALILRNDGNDFYVSVRNDHNEEPIPEVFTGNIPPGARLRTPMAAIIAREVGFKTVSPVQYAAVFINGEYYGFVTINVRIDTQFLQSLYDAPSQNFQILEGGCSFVRTNDEYLRNTFAQLLDYARAGFTEYTLQAAHEFFCTDDLLLYYAIQIYIANYNWPGSNIRIWRYVDCSNSTPPRKHLDGRWRFVMWDLDHSLLLRSYNTQQSSHPNTRSIRRVMGSRSPVFGALLRLPQYAEQFANLICDMAFGHFSVENVDRVIQQINDMSLREFEYSVYANFPGHSFYDALALRERVRYFIQHRPYYILNELRYLFGFTDMYRIVSTDGLAQINTLNGNEGTYFIENRVPVTPRLEDGQIFGHWIVNGETRYEEDILISAEYANADGVVYIQMATE
ncbi:MAG: CotH kinase family protein [Defluviitaleaceae bacterium]|nr:CotH kinase family protein [Defluviitaleaceae bacterium]MCL2261622.1 CotH kinase family protein [Defluviitaleaceae bacterium]